FWGVMLICLMLIWLLIGARGRAAQGPAQAKETGPRMLSPEEHPAAVREVMDVRIAIQEDGAQSFRGPLRSSAEAVYQRLKQALAPGILPLMREDERFGINILLLPKPAEGEAPEKPVRPWLHWGLFALTAITTAWAGAAHRGVEVLEDPWGIQLGLPYAIGLLLILGVHELGHYFMARRHGMNVTPPYFIPVPFALGTFGAFIKMKSPPENRRALFDVAIAGPLAGLAMAIPALLLGLQDSSVALTSTADDGFFAGTLVRSSILFGLLAKLSLGDAITYTSVLRLSPLAFAGWLGFFLTALNLVPVGQLDGGHIARAVFGGRTGQAISSIGMWSILLLSLFVWPGLMMWALIIFFLAGRGAPPLNDVTPLSRNRRALGCFAFVILGLILAPMPESFWNFARIACPYL
nr:site-2 protease family protein [Verrucomicrobiota bacterium]